MEYFLKTAAVFYSVLYCSLLQASQWGQTTIADPVLGSRMITYEKKNGYAMVEGDLLLGKLKDIEHPSAVITLRIGGLIWPHASIAYEIDEDLLFENKLAIVQAIDHWKKNSTIQFIELTSKNRHLYRDYISFVPAPGTICASFVGRQGGRQVIQLSPRCTTMNTVHEIGHALGLWHEQSRADRDSYVRIAWENIEENHKYNFNQHLTDGKDYGEYDYQSIMHYGPYAFSKNGQKTIIPLDDEAEIGQRKHLSPKDIAAINLVYEDE